MTVRTSHVEVLTVLVPIIGPAMQTVQVLLE